MKHYSKLPVVFVALSLVSMLIGCAKSNQNASGATPEQAKAEGEKTSANQEQVYREREQRKSNAQNDAH